MASAGEGQFSVDLEWLDPHSQLLRSFQLKYFEVDATLQIYDVAQKRMFLKRVAPPENTRLKDLFLGNTVTIYSRKMKVVGYSDDRTARFFGTLRSRCVALLMPRSVRRLGAILQGIRDEGIDIGRMKMLRFSPAQAREYLSIGGKVSEGDVKTVTSGATVAVELVAADCWRVSQYLAGDSSAIRLSPSEEAVAKEAAYAFEQVWEATALYRDCTVCVIRPHAVVDGNGSAIVSDIQAAGFTISALSTVEFGRGGATDLLSAYKGVVPEYSEWVEGLASGQAWALELVGEDVAHKFRELAGPYNPEIGALLRPGTLRSKFGKNSAENAVHCTDLTTDGPLESKFIFHVLERD